MQTRHAASLQVTVAAQSDLYDVYLDTEPHVNGHFSDNFFDLKAGETRTVDFIPVNPTTNLDSVKLTMRTLNSLYR